MEDCKKKNPKNTINQFATTEANSATGATSVRQQRGMDWVDLPVGDTARKTHLSRSSSGARG